MWQEVFFIARKDVQYIFKDKETLIWVFVMPIVFFYFIGTITSGFQSSGSGPERVAVKMGDNPGFLADQLLRRLEDRGFVVDQPETESGFNEYSRRLIVPRDFTDSIQTGQPVKVQFHKRRSGLGGDYDDIRIGRAIYTVLADIVVSGGMGEPLTSEALETLNGVPRNLALEVSPAGKRQKIPTGFEQAIPGIMVMFTLMIMVNSGAALLVIERRQGLLRRLAVTPISRTSVVMGKGLGKLLVGIIQITFAMLAGTLLFNMEWGPDLAMIILVMLVYGAMMAALGMLLGSLVRTEGQGIAIGTCSGLALAALGGCWWPIEITPGWMQSLQLFLPTGWAMDALHRLISFQAGPTSVSWHIVGMALATIILTGLCARYFRYQ